MDTLGMRANVLIQTIQNGKVVNSEELHNLIVNVGKERVAKLLGGVDSVLPFSVIAIGEGASGGPTSAEVTDTELNSEVVREVVDVYYEEGYKCVFEHTFEFSTGDSYVINEAAVMDASTAGELLNRFIFGNKPVDIDTSLYVKVEITVGSV